MKAPRLWLAAGVAGGIAALVVFLVGGDGSTPIAPAETATPGRSPATPTATPDLGPDGAPILDLTVADPIGILDGRVLYWTWAGIEGPYQNLFRAYRATDGEVVIENLYENLPGARAELAASIQDVATGRLAALVCRKSYCGGYGPPQPDSEAVLVLSDDGGVTWREAGVMPVGWFPWMFLGDELLAVQYDDFQTQQQYHFVLYPSGRHFDVPAGYSPARLGDGRLVFLGIDEGRRVQDESGNVLYEPPTLPRVAGSAPILELPSLNWTQWWTEAAVWLGERSGGRFTRVYRFAGGGLYLHEGLSAAQVIGRRDTPDLSARTPVVIDLDAGTTHAILGLGGERAFFVALGVLDGAFAAARPGSGDCLNVRAGPSMTAAVRACVADGVLLRLIGEEQTASDVTWARVRTPAGTEGWASREFLR